MSDAIAPIVVDTDDPVAGPSGDPQNWPLIEGPNGAAAPVQKTQSQGSSSAGSSTKPSLSSRLDQLKISTIRQHYYPEGGWGWMICACAFVIHMMTTGLLLSYGVLYGEVLREFGEEYAEQATWLGSLGLATGLFLSPLIVAFCRRKSTRLTAVFGGLTAALGCLFTSFASQMHQVFLSYGFVMALGLGLARVTSTLMIGQYFKRRRDRVEVVVTSGIGCGVVVFSYSFAKIIRLLGWRLGLHAITGMAVLPFFLGICYRSASLYHPQRRAILHLKNQRKKIKDKSGISDKPPFFDWAPLRSASLLVAMLATALCSLGLYTPFFYFVPVLLKDQYDESDALQLQLHLGSAFVAGCCLFGLLVVRRTADCIVSKQYLCQAAMVALGLGFMAVHALDGSYNGYVLFAWMYGVPCGGLHYALKMLVFEKIRAKSFSRAWSYVEWAQSVPVLVGIPATGYINKNHGPRNGFLFSAACSFAGALSLLLSHLTSRHHSATRSHGSCSTCTSQAPSEPYRCTSQDFNALLNSSRESSGAHAKCQKTISFSDTIDVAEDSPRWTKPEDEKRFDFEQPPQPPPPPQCVEDMDVICYDDEEEDEDKPVVHEDAEVPVMRYGCGHYEGQFDDVIPVQRRQMTVIEEVTSSV